MSKYDLKQLEDKIERCKKLALNEINDSEIDDLEDINISKKIKGEDRILDFLNKITNPYIFKINGKKIKIEFASNNINAEDCITSVIANLYR